MKYLRLYQLYCHHYCFVYALRIIYTTMADKRFRRNIPLLHTLEKTSPRKRQKMIETLSDDTINALCDCACNIKGGNVPLSTHQFKSLKPYHKHLKLLSKKSTSQKKKRKTLQSGGFLGFLLKPIAKLLFGGLKL